jgi:hypothetical protein
MSKGYKMRSAMAMIELIFAIVIIAISIMSIPTMMNIADNASKGMMIDEDVLKRMSAEITKIYSARWDENSTAPFGPLQSTSLELNCSRVGGLYRNNPNTTRECLLPSSPMMPATPIVNSGDVNLSKGLEQLHGASYEITIDTNNNYTIPLSYDVSYVDSSIGALDVDGIATATWKLGMGSNSGLSHLKRIVVRSQGAASGTNIVLTFFKSNTGMVSE